LQYQGYWSAVALILEKEGARAFMKVQSINPQPSTLNLEASTLKLLKSALQDPKP
jgi:hypothetical protein